MVLLVQLALTIGVLCIAALIQRRFKHRTSLADWFLFIALVAASLWMAISARDEIVKACQPRVFVVGLVQGVLTLAAYGIAVWRAPLWKRLLPALLVLPALPLAAWLSLLQRGPRAAAMTCSMMMAAGPMIVFLILLHRHPIPPASPVEPNGYPQLVAAGSTWLKRGTPIPDSTATEAALVAFITSDAGLLASAHQALDQPIDRASSRGVVRRQNSPCHSLLSNREAAPAPDTRRFGAGLSGGRPRSICSRASHSCIARTGRIICFTAWVRTARTTAA